MRYHAAATPAKAKAANANGQSLRSLVTEPRNGIRQALSQIRHMIIAEHSLQLFHAQALGTSSDVAGEIVLDVLWSIADNPANQLGETSNGVFLAGADVDDLVSDADRKSVV